MVAVSPRVSTLVFATLHTAPAQRANCSVDSVSETQGAEGLMHAMSTVRALPPIESCSRNVSLLSRYGMCKRAFCFCASPTYTHAAHAVCRTLGGTTDAAASVVGGVFRHPGSRHRRWRAA